jgi:hypothetical protein
VRKPVPPFPIGIGAFVALTFRRPSPYWAWAILVTAALAIGYFYDPYVFGFAAMILGGLSAGVAAAGVGFMAFGTFPDSRARRALLAPLALTGVVLAAAFALLGTFKWA